MHLLRRSACVLSLCAACLAPAAAAPATSSDSKLVRLRLSATLPLDSVLARHFDVASVRRGGWVDVVLHPGEEPRLQALGAPFELRDDALERHYAERARRELATRPRPEPAKVLSAVRPDGVFRVEALPPVGSGSMGGFWTLAEVKMKLDSLVASDTRDLVADKLDTLGYSLEGRPIWGLRLGKAAPAPDPRPVVYYSALTHAREAEGMQALFWFVDDLLGRYDTDLFAKYLLEHRRIYICPVVNPDGYAYNQATDPAGGGMWRKNRRANAGGSYGVDINRNFGFKWGYDNIGSSPTPTDEDYRGTAAFSEPEARVQRDAVSALAPPTGITFHTYSDDFIHPWGYTNQPTSDAAAFYEWNDEATLGSPYIAGDGPHILYSTNGDFNDWSYGDTLAKPRCFSWTPEIGTESDGFWPPPSRIVPLAEENLRKAYTVAAIAGPYVRVESSALAEGELTAGNLAHLAVRARNLGLAPTPPNLRLTLAALDAGVEVLPGGALTYPALASRTSADAAGGATFLVAAYDSVTPGRLVRFAADFTADSGYFSRDTVEVILGRPTPVLVEACNATTNWTVSSGWGVVASDAGHPDRYFADSPAGNYPGNANLRLVYKGRLDLSAGVHAWALLETKWYLEQTYDGTVVEASLDSLTWTALAGRGSSGGVYQSGLQGKPVYQASRFNWMKDRLDLSALAGPAGSLVRLRFRTVSDFYTSYDGFDFDSLRVLVYDPAEQPAPALTAVDAVPGTTLELAQPRPNPARETARLGFTLPRAATLTLEVHDVQGRRVRTLASARYGPGRYVLSWDLRDDLGRPVAPGIYLARLSVDAGTKVRRLVVLR